MAIFGIFLPLWAWQILIAVLRAAGVTGLAGTLSLKLIMFLESKLKNAKSYHENNDFPQPFPGQTNQHNFTVGEEPK